MQSLKLFSLDHNDFSEDHSFGTMTYLSTTNRFAAAHAQTMLLLQPKEKAPAAGDLHGHKPVAFSFRPVSFCPVPSRLQ